MLVIECGPDEGIYCGDGLVIRNRSNGSARERTIEIETSEGPLRITFAPRDRRRMYFYIDAPDTMQISRTTFTQESHQQRQAERRGKHGENTDAR